MNVERFTIPEILFRPAMIGIDQAGIAESIYNSVEELPERKINKNIYILEEKYSIKFRYSTKSI